MTYLVSLFQSNLPFPLFAVNTMLIGLEIWPIIGVQN